MSIRYLDLVKGVCGPGTVRNPYTDRCNKACKRTHERIRDDTLKRYRCYKKCGSNQIRDKHTKRCRGKQTTVTRSRSRSKRSRSLEQFYQLPLRPRSQSRRSQSKSKSKSQSKSRRSQSKSSY